LRHCGRDLLTLKVLTNALLVWLGAAITRRVPLRSGAPRLGGDFCRFEHTDFFALMRAKNNLLKSIKNNF
jgi:hypothetical protein